MTRSTAAALLGLALALAAFVAGPLSGLSAGELNHLLVFSNATLGLSLVLAGWPIAAYRPDIRIGWLLLAAGIAYASTGGGIALLRHVANAGWQDHPVWRVAGTVTGGGWAAAIGIFLPMALLLFPDGRLPGPRWRWPAGLTAGSGVLFVVLGAFSGFSGQVGVRGYGVLGAEQAWLGAVAAVGIMTSYLGVLAAIVTRFRRGSERVRRQMLWVMLALLVVVLVFALDPLLPDSVLSIYPIALVPLAILIAVFRHQLFDIRLVFSRSLLYLLLTGLIIGGYLGIVALPLGASVAATLAVAAAFNPVRVWLQRRVDRAVYGARHDPVRAIAEVGARLGGDGLDGVLDALCAVMRLPSAAIVAHGRQLAGHGAPPAALRAIPLHHGDERIGELMVGLRYGESALDPDDERILTLLAAPIAVAVHATRLAEDLGRSRERMISAREEERRRLRRDLHDGLGPVLTGVVLNAEAALRLVRTAPDRSEELLRELRDNTTGALDDIRRLVYELRPPALDSLGLAGALREYAVVLSRRAGDAPLTVSVDAAEPLGELPAAVEVAAYRIVTEALTNVTRHSSAGSAVVGLAVRDGELRVSVHDDGSNPDNGGPPGVGLTSIRERAAELGGRCVIRLDRTGGRVDVSLPLALSAGGTP